MQIDVLANAGLPMIFWQLPVLVIAFIPTVLLETAVVRLHLKKPFVPLLGGVTVANAVSTFVGIPLAWLTMVAIQFFAGSSPYDVETPLAAFQTVIVQSAWLIPYEEDGLFWLLPTATLVLLAPYFIASVTVEWIVLRRIWKTEPSRVIFKTAWRINLVSYVALLALTLLWLWQNLEQYGTAG